MSDAVEDLKVARRHLAAASEALEHHDEGGNLAEVYEGALAWVEDAAANVENALLALAPEEES